INLMIDRAALVLPRLPRSGQSSEQALNHLLHTLRIGLCVMRLRRWDAHADKEIKEVLTCLTHPTDINTLLERIVSLTERSLSVADELSRHHVNQLVDLYCALSTQEMEPADDQ
ncbi:FUSC family protein, partial [Klebsiella pneumoniae]